MEIKELYHSIQKLIWSDYDYKYALKNKIISKKFKRPSDYNRDFYIYWEEEDIHGNTIKTEELYEGSQKRSIFWVPSYQK